MPSPEVTGSAATLARLRAAGCVYAQDEARLLAAAVMTPAQESALVDRRVAGEPLEQILGWAEFAGLRILLEPGVFIPRPRTQFLVEVAAQFVASRSATQTLVLDLCCGSGALGLALAQRIATMTLFAGDIDPVAVTCARRNFVSAGLPTENVRRSDLFEALPSDLHGRVDIVLANTPYVPTADLALLPAEAREYEARIALDGGADGLDVQRRLISAAPPWLAPDGRVLVETSHGQAADVAELFARNGLRPRIDESPEYVATVVSGTRPR